MVLILGAGLDRLEEKVASLREVVASAGDTTPEPSILSLSVGIAIYPKDGNGAEVLLAEADRRMYRSKWLRRKAVPGSPSPADLSESALPVAS